jgi:dipeptidyl aminopeptidase/acylaminoacyl peptidase
MPDTAGLIFGLNQMLAQGYVVTATDYPGLGTQGIHPFLIGVSEDRAVLDSVRAARDLPNSGASNRFVVWGHSQGGMRRSTRASLRRATRRTSSSMASARRRPRLI